MGGWVGGWDELLRKYVWVDRGGKGSLNKVLWGGGGGGGLLTVKTEP